MKYGINKLRAIGITLFAAFVLMACGGATAMTTPSATSQPPNAPASTESASAPTPTSGSGASATNSGAQGATATPALANAKLNLNQVTEEQLLNTIPNFSNRMVREFFEYRPYVSIQQFRKEIGKYVTADQVTAYEQYVYVPVDVNNADAATLQQLPGVDAAAAEALIAGRPYDSNATFLAKLAQQMSNADLQQIESYLVVK